MEKKEIYVMAIGEECIAPLNDFCDVEETWPDCINCKYYKPKKNVENGKERTKIQG